MVDAAEIKKKKKKNRSIQKAMRNLGKAEEYYAKAIMFFSNKTSRNANSVVPSVIIRI